MPRPSISRVINPFFPLLLRFWKHICLFFFLSTVALAGLIYLLFLLPLKISDCHERLYFQEIEKHESREFQWEYLPTMRDTFMIKPSPWNQRPIRMIQDAIQLTTHGWRGTMQLYADGTGKYPAQEYMIYVGGTPPNASEPWHKQLWRDLSFFTHPGPGTCVDPPEICQSFNEAFNTVLEQMHPKNGRTAHWPLLRFVDCDNSPLVCDWLGVDPVMLIHVTTGHCEYHFPPMSHTCDMKWTFIPLPLPELPVHRKQRLSDGRIVPRFPSALEQLSSVILYHGSWEAFENSTDPAYIDWIRAPRKTTSKDEDGEDSTQETVEKTVLAQQFDLFNFIEWIIGDYDEDDMSGID